MIKTEGKKMVIDSAKTAVRLGLMDPEHLEAIKAATGPLAKPADEPYNMTSKEVCAYMKVQPWTLDRLRKEGKLRFRKITRKQVRYRRSDVDACIEACHHEEVPASWGTGGAGGVAGADEGDEDEEGEE